MGIAERMSHADEVPDVDVEKADQQRNYEDAQTEMMLMDDEDKIKFAVGDTYSCLDADSANEKLEEEIEELQKLLEKQEEDMNLVVETMSELKTALYAKFGKSINLEEN